MEVSNTNHTNKEMNTPSTLVSNGCVNYEGSIADKQQTGGWKSAPFIIVNEVAERFAFFSIAVNMVPFLVGVMHQSLPEAATHVTNWSGGAYVLTLVGAFVADAYLGRFFTIITFSCIYAVGMVMLTLSGSLSSLHPPPCTTKPCPTATSSQTGFLYFALTLIALGTGGIKPCVSSFGADQFDESDPKEARSKYAFFNWFFFAINMGALCGITFLVYVRVEFGWTLGFVIPTVAMVTSIGIIGLGFRKYRYQKPMGSAFTRFLQVAVCATRNHLKGAEVREGGKNLYEVRGVMSGIKGARKLPHTEQYRFLDKAAVQAQPEHNTSNPWRLCTVTQVEELKCFLRILPVWASTTALSISYAQLSTFFIGQANTMNLNITNNFKMPSSSIPVFSSINALVVVPIYEKFIVKWLRKRTGLPRGITSLQRMGTGLFVSVFAVVFAALVEKARRHESLASHTKMSVFWLFPQCFLIGTAEVFTYVGQLEFFYDEATDGTRSLSSAVFLSEIGIGSWLSSLLVTIVEKTTGGVKQGWLRDNLDNSRLDYFYWILVGINVVNFFIYLWVSWRYKGRSGGHGDNDQCVELAEDEEGNHHRRGNGDEGYYKGDRVN